MEYDHPGKCEMDGTKLVKIGDEKSPFPEEPALPLGKTSANPYASSSRSRDPDLELINSKLDTLKAMLSALEQRLATLEKSLESNKKERLW